MPVGSMLTVPLGYSHVALRSGAPAQWGVEPQPVALAQHGGGPKDELQV